jgi:CarboxypepD_reg-like domain/Secretion system C-terminal sorting domain
MTQKLQLQIPTPCHENWDKMTGLDQGRFCASCQQKVIDFSNMSDREIALFFKKPSTGSVCGRFMQNQLERDIEIPRKRIPWVKFFFHFLLPGFLLSIKATAQGRVTVMEKDIKLSPKPPKEKKEAQNKKVVISSQCGFLKGDIDGRIDAIDKPANSGQSEIVLLKVAEQDTKTINGKVIDEKGHPISFATIMMKGTKKGTVSDQNGQFSISHGKLNGDTLVISSIGFYPKEIKTSYVDNQNIVLVEMKEQIMGQMITVTRKKIKPLPLLQRIFKDTAFSKFRIYPNPIQSNSPLNVEWNQKQYGNHTLELFNQTGQLVLKREMYIDKETRILSVNIPSLMPGSYFFRVTNKTSGKSYTEKIIVSGK